MSHWTELVDALKGKGLPLQVASDRATVVFHYNDGRTQKVIATRLDDDWCEIVSAFSPAGGLDGDAALERNEKLLGGAVCRRAGALLVRQTLALAFLDVATLEFYLRRVAGRADALEQGIATGDEF